MDGREQVKTDKVFEAAGGIASQLLPNGGWVGITTCVQTVRVSLPMGTAMYTNGILCAVSSLYHAR